MTAEEDRAAIAALAEGLTALAGGDLTHEITAAFADKTRPLRDSSNASVGALHTTLAQVSAAVREVREASTQISEASHSLIEGAADQTTNLDEVSQRLQADAVTQITAAVDQIRHITRTVTSNAEQSASTAVQLQAQAMTLGDFVAFTPFTPDHEVPTPRARSVAQPAPSGGAGRGSRRW